LQKSDVVALHLLNGSCNFANGDHMTVTNHSTWSKTEMVLSVCLVEVPWQINEYLNLDYSAENLNALTSPVSSRMGLG